MLLRCTQEAARPAANTTHEYIEDLARTRIQTRTVKDERKEKKVLFSRRLLRKIQRRQLLIWSTAMGGRACIIICAGWKARKSGR